MAIKCTTNSHSSTQEIRRLLWNRKFHYHVHNSPSLVPVLSQLNPVHKVSPNFSKIHSKYYPPVYAQFSY